MAYTPERIEKIRVKLEKYIKATPIPIVVEFAYKNNVRRQFLYECEALSDTVKKLIEKKEAQLERLGLAKKIDKTMAIFSLKQLGWRDMPEVSPGFDANKVAEGFAKMVHAAGTGTPTSPNNSL